MALRRKWSSPHLLDSHARARELRAGRSQPGRWSGLIAELSFAREYLSEETLRDEPGLAQSTWLAYGYMSAVERTELFAREYEAVFRRLHGQYKDHNEAQSMQPVHPELVRNARAEMTSLWKARQCADALGVPYPFFLRVSMEKAIGRLYVKVPRPNQLCMPWQISAVEAAWEREREIVQLFADDWDPRFFAPSGRRDPARAAAVDALVERVMSKPPGNRALTLANFLFRRLAITEVEARAHFGDADVDEALTMPSTPTVELPAATQQAFRPHCLGMLSAASPPPCIACVVRAACEKLRAIVDTKFLKGHGTTDPLGARQREMAAERKRRQRCRDREARMQTGN